MKLFINFLIILNVALGVFIIFKASFKKTFEINHIMLFFIGFLFYWMIPIVIGVNKIFYEKKAMQLWFEIFDRISPIYIIFYLLNTLLFGILFYLGGVYFKKRRRNFEAQNFSNEKKSKFLDFDIKYLNIFYFIDLIAILYYIYQFRFAFFKGYETEITLTLTKGTFVAVSLVMLMLSVIVIVKKKEENSNINFIRAIMNKYTITYFIVAILILSLGGRMYILSSVIMYFVIYTKYFKRIKLITVILVGISGVIAAGSIGVMRQGSVGFDISDIILNVLLEPLYTGFSIIAFLYQKINALLQIPIYFLSDFINLVPSAILPNKLDYILQPTFIYNPQGALSSYVSFMMNFGIIGTGMVMFGLNYLLSYMKNNKNSLLIKTFYIAICGWLPFTFFRDELFVSVIKNMLEFSIMIPFIMVLTAHILTNKKYYLNKMKSKRIKS